MKSFFDKISKLRKRLVNSLLLFYLEKNYGRFIVLNNVQLGKHFDLDIKSNDFEIRFGKNVYFRKNSTVTIRRTGKVYIGNNVFFNNYISINCHSNIRIGDNCLFGENVKIYDHNHKFRDKNSPIAGQGYSYGDISIGNNCWIGSNVVILKGVKIGNNVVIGANCVIDKDVAENTIVKAGGGLELISY